MTAESYDADTQNLILSGFKSTEPVEFVVEYYHNEPGAFTFSYKVPHDLTAGYSVPPADCRSWVHFPDSFTIEPFMTTSVPVSLEVPAGAITKPTQFEFWVVVNTPPEAIMPGITQRISYVQNWLVSLTVRPDVGIY